MTEFFPQMSMSQIFRNDLKGKKNRRLEKAKVNISFNRKLYWKVLVYCKPVTLKTEVYWYEVLGWVVKVILGFGLTKLFWVMCHSQGERNVSTGSYMYHVRGGSGRDYVQSRIQWVPELWRGIKARIQKRYFCFRYYLSHGTGHDTMLSWPVLSIRIVKVAFLNTALRLGNICRAWR